MLNTDEVRLHLTKILWLALVVAVFAGCRTFQSQAETQSSAAGQNLTTSDVGIQAAWMQLGPGGVAIAKVITADQACPALGVDGTTMPMTIRAAPTATYNVTTCELHIPAGARSVTLGSQSLPMPATAPRRIIVVGDTGCEIKATGSSVATQNCNKPSAWPLAQVSQQIAAAKPDLIIHVGDYHYRETPCPASDQNKCGGAAVGDNWPSWRQDFFTPAAPMLKAAPLVLVRGNHELCQRAGNGWFQFLDPRPIQACSDAISPYWVSFGSHQLAVVDAADDKNMQPSFNQLQPLPGQLVWWTMHRPFLTPLGDDETTGTPPTLPQAWQAAGSLQLVLTGHKHLMSLTKFTNSQPPELISGNGGTALEKLPANGQALQLLNQRGATTIENYAFGYLDLIDRGAGEWTVTEYSATGGIVVVCNLQEAVNVQTTLFCKAADGSVSM